MSEELLPDTPRSAAAPATAELERWKRMKAIFVDVVEQQRTAREAALAEIAAEDPEAAEEARSLLRRFEEAATSLIDRPALFALEPQEEVPDLTGRRIDGYRLVSARGRGGMGTVYEAVREEDGKRVAVKLLRWKGDPIEVAAQVRSERRILAALEHDNIARLIDGGVTDDGLPYFTLEYVDGQPIRAYCEERALGVDARLELFRTVCGAVEYAHRRLVIHCDIKPANIQVTHEGVPKLLDFGIARLRRPGEAAHAEGESGPPSALTPEYASPEQVRGEPVTTATDVYALGLLLYELLAGRRAQALESIEPAEIRRVVCASEPPPPSEASPPERRRRLRGDLDAIVARAIAKEPAARYGSAHELAEDVRRHLESRPVHARGGGAPYRAARFVRRHRAAFTAGLLVTASLVGGTVAALREADRAQRRFEDVRKLAGSFLFELHDAIRDLPGATPARRLMVAKSLEYLDVLAREAGDERELLRELAMAYERVGDVQGYTANANLGDAPGAAASYDKAVAIAERLAAAAPDDRTARATLATALERRGTMAIALGDRATAHAALDRARSLLDALLAELPGDRDAAHDLHVVHLRRGQLRQQEGAVDAALDAYREAERVDAALLAAVPGDKRALRDQSVALSYIASVEGQRDPARGLELYAALLPPAIALAESDPTNAQLQRDLLVGYEDVAQMQGELGHFEESLANHGRAQAIAEALLAADPTNLQALQDLSVRHAQIGDVYLEMGRLPDALASYRRSLEIDARVLARDPTNAKSAEYLGWSHMNVAGVLAKSGRAAAGGSVIDHYRQAIAVATPPSERDPQNAQLRSLLADAWAGLGEALYASGGCGAEARAALERAVALWDALSLEPGPDREHRDAVAAKLAGCR